MQPWTMGDEIRAEGRWSIAGLRAALAGYADTRFPTVTEVFGN
jgi:hypothetical protein